MRELLRSTDPVRLSFVEALLRDSGIVCTVLDHHTSIAEGSIGALPRRVTVADGDFIRARALLREVGEI